MVGHAACLRVEAFSLLGRECEEASASGFEGVFDVVHVCLMLSVY